MKSTLKLTLLSLSVALLLACGCQPPVDRNAETQDNTVTSAENKDDTPVIVADPNATPSAEEHRISDASAELVPDALKIYTEFPTDKSPTSLKAYLDSLESSEFQAVFISLAQAQDENARMGIQVAFKIIRDNAKLAADLIFGSEDATLEEYRSALQYLLVASDDLDKLQTQVKAGRFPELVSMVELQVKINNLQAKADVLKEEDVEAFYAEYNTELDDILKAEVLELNQMESLFRMARVFSKQPEKELAVYEKIQASLKGKEGEDFAQYRSMIEQSIAQAKEQVEIMAITPEMVVEQLAPYKVLPTEKNPTAYIAYVDTIRGDEFQTIIQKLMACKKEDVRNALTGEMEVIQKNIVTVVEETMKSETATEEEFTKALEFKFSLVMFGTNPEEDRTLAEVKKDYVALQEELAKGRFPQTANVASCYVTATAILEKLDPYFKSVTEPSAEETQQLKEAVYPELATLVKQACNADALEGLPMQVIIQTASLFRNEKEKVKPIFEEMIKALETKTDEESQALLRSLKMQLAMIENPQAMSGHPGSEATLPEAPKMTPEELDEAKKKLEVFLTLPETRDATALCAYIHVMESDEFQSAIRPLYLLAQNGDADIQAWLTEFTHKLENSWFEAATFVCKSEDATEEQYSDALDFRLSIMYREQRRDGTAPDYATLTEEVKNGRFPALISMVEVESATATIMKKVNELFSTADAPTSEQKDALFSDFSTYLDKVVATDSLEKRLQMIMQVASIFMDDNVKMKQICETLLKALEGKTDEQSKQLADMFQHQLDEIKFLTEPMTFTAPEGTDLDELKKLVTEKMEIIMRSGTQNAIPNEKLTEFLVAVEKFGNVDLTDYTSWQIELIHLIPIIYGDNFNADDFQKKYIACVKTGVEKELFNLNCLQMCLQMALVMNQNLVSQEDYEAQKAKVVAMLEALLPVCETLKVPEAEMYHGNIKSQIEQLMSAPKETDTSEAPKPVAAALNVEALPEAINLEEDTTEAIPMDVPEETLEGVSKETENGVSMSDDITYSTSVSTIEEDIEIEDADGADEAGDIEIPAQLLNAVTLPENATLKDATTFLEQAEVVEEMLFESGNAELVEVVGELLTTNRKTACDVIFSAKDVTEETFHKALNYRIKICFYEDLEEIETITANLTELEEVVKVSAFPQFLSQVTTCKDLVTLCAEIVLEANLYESVSEESFEKAKQVIPATLKNSVNSEDPEVSLVLAIVDCTEYTLEQKLEMLQIIEKSTQNKDSERWEAFRTYIMGCIDTTEKALLPFTFSDDATLDEMKETVDARVQIMITSAVEIPKMLSNMKKVVEAKNNDELSAYVSWYEELIEIMQLGTHKKENLASILEKLTELANRATEIGLTENSFYHLTIMSYLVISNSENSGDCRPLVTQLNTLGETFASEEIQGMIDFLNQLVSLDDNSDDDIDDSFDSFDNEEEEEVEDDEEENEVDTDSTSMTFTVPEGTDQAELREAVSKKMNRLIEENIQSDPMAVLETFVDSVEELKNDDLTTFAQWNAEFYSFFLVTLRDPAIRNDVNIAGEKLTNLVVSGTEKKTFTTETLMMVAQITPQLVSVLDDAHALALTDAVLRALDDSKESWVPQVKEMLSGKVAQLQLPGNTLELEAETLDGESVKIEDFAGKTVLIDVWATWCGPCVAEIPNMRQAYDAYHDAGFEIIGLSLDNDLKALEKFQEKNQLPWVIATQKNMPVGTVKFDEKYGITGIPTMFMVGADGKVITVKARGNLMEILAEIYPDVKIEAETDADVPEEIDLEEDEDVTVSEATATTTEAGAIANSETRMTILDVFSSLPTGAGKTSAIEFLQNAENSMYDIQMALRQMPEMEAMAAFQKMQSTFSQAADIILASSEATPDELKIAVTTKMNAINFASMQIQGNTSNTDFVAAYEALIAQLDKHNVPALALEVKVALLNVTTMRRDRMPTMEDMTVAVTKIGEICADAVKTRTMNGDVMGHFMQFIVLANDTGVAPALIDKACVALRDAVIATGDPQLLNTADFITGLARRAALKGKTMELIGVTLDGKEVDIQKDYAGKVVLVDFWATWCNPCVMELSNLERQYYAKYHDKGFEILGFSIDADKNQLASFLERRKLPWQTIMQKDNATGSEEPVYYYGIQAIPCLFLVGPDGKVITEIPTMRRDEVLSAELKKIYGE